MRLANKTSVNFSLTTVTDRVSIYFQLRAASSVTIYSSIFNSCTEGEREEKTERKALFPASLLVAVLGMEAGASHCLGKYPAALNALQALGWI